MNIYCCRKKQYRQLGVMQIEITYTSKDNTEPSQSRKRLEGVTTKGRLSPNTLFIGCFSIGYADKTCLLWVTAIGTPSNLT